MRHQPATPLPWALSEKCVVRIAPQASLAGKEDRKYLTHAANAYPKLVEALRDAWKGDLPIERYAEIGALLRDLGEDG